jgi:hypothetical protein
MFFFKKKIQTRIFNFTCAVGTCCGVMSKRKNKFGGQHAAAADDEGRRPLKDEDEDSDSEDEVGRMGGHGAPADGATGKGKLAQFEAAGKRGKGAPGAGDGKPVFRNKQRVLVLSSRGITHRYTDLCHCVCVCIAASVLTLAARVFTLAARVLTLEYTCRKRKDTCGKRKDTCRKRKETCRKRKRYLPQASGNLPQLTFSLSLFQ